MSQEAYVADCLRKIATDYILIKKASSNSGNAWYCLPKSAFEKLPAPSRTDALSRESNLTELRRKLRIVKHAPSHQQHQAFSEKREMFGNIFTYFPIANLTVQPWDMDMPSQLPYTVYPVSGGGSLEEYQARLARSAQKVPEGFMWHIMHSLLSLLKLIRGNYPLHAHDAKPPITHNAITPKSIVIEPVASSYNWSCYPKIQLIDFENAEYIPAPPPGTEGPHCDPQMADNIWAVRKILHELAHEKHLLLNATTWRFEQGPRGACLCQKLTPANVPFSADDESFMHFFNELGRPDAHQFDQPKLDTLIYLANIRRNFASYDAGIANPKAIAPLRQQWDVCAELVTDDELEEVLRAEQQKNQPTGLGVTLG